MKKILTILILTLGLFSCLESQEEVGERIRKNYTVEKIEGCEYIIYHDSYRGFITHKGDCVNDIHDCTLF